MVILVLPCNLLKCLRTFFPAGEEPLSPSCEWGIRHALGAQAATFFFVAQFAAAGSFRHGVFGQGCPKLDLLRNL